MKLTHLVSSQGMMISSKCKQNVHKHIPIISVKKNPTSKTETIFYCKLQDFLHI